MLLVMLMMVLCKFDGNGQMVVTMIMVGDGRSWYQWANGDSCNNIAGDVDDGAL